MKKVLLTSVAMTAMSVATAQAAPILMASGHYSGSTYEVWSQDKPLSVWNQADAAALGGSTGSMTLATVKSQGEQDFIYDLVQSTLGHKITFYWLGGDDKAVEGDWRWTADGSNDLFSDTYSNWAPGEPNNNWGGIGIPEDVVYLYGATGTWNDTKEGDKIWGAVYEAPKVSEPATLGLMGLGLLGLGAAAARRRKAA